MNARIPNLKPTKITSGAINIPHFPNNIIPPTNSKKVNFVHMEEHCPLLGITNPFQHTTGKELFDKVTNGSIHGAPDTKARLELLNLQPCPLCVAKKTDIARINETQTST